MSLVEEHKIRMAEIWHHDLPGVLMQRLLQEMEKLVNWSEQDQDDRVQVDHQFNLIMGLQRNYDRLRSQINYYSQEDLRYEFKLLQLDFPLQRPAAHRSYMLYDPTDYKIWRMQQWIRVKAITSELPDVHDLHLHMALVQTLISQKL